MGIPRVIPKVIKGQGGKALPFGTTLSAGLDLVLEDTTQHSISSIYNSATTRPHLLPPPLMLRLLQRKPPPPQLQPHMLVSGIVHVDALSIFYGTLRKLAASHLPSSVSGWLAILAPVLDSFLKSVGNGRIVVFHVDGRLAETGIKQQAHASRTLDVLRAAATAQQLCAKRKDRRRCGALEK
ncbi:hypothetical protein BC831DRAFT_164841 [Entophlyctis helioformis]|nr:hypothetical protein BC831DRAFT_164841 [Entophlyctis helioformis]